MTSGSQSSTRVHVLVITALPDELDGIKAVEDGAGWEERQDSAGFPYHVREFTHARGGIMRVAVARPVDMSTAPASNVATRLVNEFKPVCLAMSGICAGRRDEVSLGDVIVASRLFDAEAGKLKATTNADGERVEEMLHEITTYNLDPRWQHRAQDWPRTWCDRWQAERPRTVTYQENWLLDALRRHEQGQGERPEAHPERKTQCPSWRDVILRLERRGLLTKTRFALTKKGRAHVDRQWFLHDGHMPEEEPLRVHVAPMATVSSVKQDPALFGRLLKLHRKVLAVDMESMAIGLVAALEQVPFTLVVKAVQDYADHDKDNSLRHFGVRVAAAFVLDFLRENLPADAFDPPPATLQDRLRSASASSSMREAVVPEAAESHIHQLSLGPTALSAVSTSQDEETTSAIGTKLKAIVPVPPIQRVCFLIGEGGMEQVQGFGAVAIAVINDYADFSNNLLGLKEDIRHDRLVDKEEKNLMVKRGFRAEDDPSPITNRLYEFISQSSMRIYVAVGRRGGKESSGAFRRRLLGAILPDRLNKKYQTITQIYARPEFVRDASRTFNQAWLASRASPQQPPVKAEPVSSSLSVSIADAVASVVAARAAGTLLGEQLKRIRSKVVYIWHADSRKHYQLDDEFP